MAQEKPTFAQRLEALCETKRAQTREKQRVIGAMDHDDWAIVLPPPERRAAPTEAVSGSGVVIRDQPLNGFTAVPTQAAASSGRPSPAPTSARSWSAIPSTSTR